MTEKDNISVKVVVLGEPAVGKTTLRQNYIGKGMGDSSKFLMTLGADLSESTIEISDKITLNAQIWDIAGQDNFAPIIGEYLRGAQGAILVYDMTRSYTFDELTKWLDRLHQANPDLDNNIPFIIAGNKADLENFYDYDEEKVNEFISYINRHELYSKTPVQHINTSAKTGYAVQEAFRTLGKTIIRNYLELGEQIDGAEDLFDNYEEITGQPSSVEVDTAPPVEVDEEERLVRPSELLKRRQEEEEKKQSERGTQFSTNQTQESRFHSSMNQEEEVSDIDVEQDIGPSDLQSEDTGSGSESHSPNQIEVTSSSEDGGSSFTDSLHEDDSDDVIDDEITVQASTEIESDSDETNFSQQSSIEDLPIQNNESSTIRSENTVPDGDPFVSGTNTNISESKPSNVSEIDHIEEPTVSSETSAQSNNNLVSEDKDSDFSDSDINHSDKIETPPSSHQFSSESSQPELNPEAINYQSKSTDIENPVEERKEETETELITDDDDDDDIKANVNSFQNIEEQRTSDEE